MEERLGEHSDGARQNGDQIKQNVLERMACLDPWDLCNEAKVEKCRATRDLRSCGRTVHHLLTSCGHACLCMECSQRCDICPICRTPIARREPVLRLRLYDECVEAGLLPSVQSEDFRERDGPYWTLDAFRLCSFFDIVLDNNLVCLICHYVTDVCMNEDAISSDPVISMLLDGAVLKEWCKRTLVITVRKLRDIYHSRPSKSKVDMLDIHARRLQGLTYVLETLEAPLNALSPSLLELQQLLESVRLVSQHLEVMTWCIKQRFLESIQSCYSSIAHWKSAYQERKRAANDRVYVGKPGVKPLGTLFIEDALSIGLGREEAESYHKGDAESSNIMPDVGLLRHGNPTDDYPPESTRAAVDFLFLEGSPDLFFAKKAIFLYYLFDRHWTLPEHDWGHIVEDYVLTFAIPRQSMLESLVFYLLDNNSDAALKEACRWLPEIVGPNMHPKIATVLLERQKADTALSVLQSTGQLTQTLDNSSTESMVQQEFNPATLPEAVTVVRVLLECGYLLSEAYLYQQSHCKAVQAGVQLDEESSRDWLEEMEVLVGEICWYCIRKNCVGKMLELPWKSSEEKTLRNILLDQAVENPASSAGSLLTVFYLQRCRFSEAYSVHKNLCHLEQQFISESSDRGASAQVQRICEQRTKLIEKSLELLPEVEREQILSGEEDTQQGSSLENDMDITPSRFIDERPHIEELPVTSTNLLMNNRKQITTPADLSLPSPRNGRLTSTPKNNSLIKSPLFAAANDSPGISPLLGKRLRYEPGKKDRTQAMVVTW